MTFFPKIATMNQVSVATSLCHCEDPDSSGDEAILNVFVVRLLRFARNDTQNLIFASALSWQTLNNQFPLYLRCPFKQLIHLGISKEPLDFIFLADPVSTMDLHAPSADVNCG